VVLKAANSDSTIKSDAMREINPKLFGELKTISNLISGKLSGTQDKRIHSNHTNQIEEKNKY
tara:strand:- start:50 stop:235 length:186 start_codon:yes stop_codon:yes gene_type:complete